MAVLGRPLWGLLGKVQWQGEDTGHCVGLQVGKRERKKEKGERIPSGDAMFIQNLFNQWAVFSSY